MMATDLRGGLAGLALGVAVALALPTFAQSPGPEPGTGQRTVTVSGTATIRSQPDEATVTLGVQTRALTAEAAMRDNAERMREVIAAVRDARVVADDIATDWVSLYPQYDEQGIGVQGYVAENQVSVTVRSMQTVGRVIDAAVEAGANLTSGISFGLSDEAAGLERALGEAVEDARSKALALAEATGAELGAVVSISETGAPGPIPVYRDLGVAEGAAGAPPIEPPTIETQVSVNRHVGSSSSDAAGGRSASLGGAPAGSGS
ncbi:MAG: hypothetical protein KatS3mg014_2607 [Actinomycetota bacterium]|nr:MAG: hypothetical protein KatS3mg014_2607 [Actinomycetota bacterium]